MGFGVEILGIHASTHILESPDVKDQRFATWILNKKSTISKIS
jgi:hypothetical protein